MKKIGENVNNINPTMKIYDATMFIVAKSNRDASNFLKS